MVIKTSIITALENKLLLDYKKNYEYFLSSEIYLVEQFFTWLKLKKIKGAIEGVGSIDVRGEEFRIHITYSPFHRFRFDRIYITNKDIQYNPSIHLYRDLALCLYHPIIDKPLLKIIPLVKMVPWISEWCINYQDWRKYKVWLGKEIKH